MTKQYIVEDSDPWYCISCWSELPSDGDHIMCDKCKTESVQ